MRITPTLLDDTLKLMQLARETARIQGQPKQADQLTPLVDNLTDLAQESRVIKPNTSPTLSSGILAQSDFKTLLATIENQSTSNTQNIIQPSSSSPVEKGFIVTCMSNGGMPSIDIARQMGMTLDEVNMILSLNRVGK